MDLDVSDRMLARYAERFDQPTIEVEPERIRVRLAQGRHGGPGSLVWLVAEGVRRPGGRVRFTLPDALQIEGALNRCEVARMGDAAQRLLLLFTELCQCARLAEDCDCCRACHGEGLRPDGEMCVECAGLGYQDADAAHCC